jgi:uncharacterized protein with GYD domain
MLFCLTGNYTPQALQGLMDHTESRLGPASKLVEAAGGKIVAMYGTIADGPGAMLIFEAEPTVAPSIAGVITASGSVQHVRFTRLLTQEEILPIRKKAAELRGSYKAAGQ